MTLVALSLASAIANAIGGILSKDLTLRLPARQLIGPLLGLNALLVAPMALLGPWAWSGTVVALHALSVFLLVTSSLAVWDLLEHGEASGTVTAQSLSPLPTAIAVAVLLPEAFDPVQAVVVVLVVGGIMAVLSDAFGLLGRLRTVLTILVVAIASGMITVAGRLLLDHGVGIFPIYLVRTSVAAAVVLIAIPPRDIPVRQAPRLAIRACFVTAHFLLILVAVGLGSPAIVQTIVATSPLFVLAYESYRTRRWPSRRLAFGAGLACVGVAVVLLL